MIFIKNSKLRKINEKLAMTSQFNLTWFYDVIMRNSVFLTRFSNSEIPDPFFISKAFFPTSKNTKGVFRTHSKIYGGAILQKFLAA